MTRFCWRAAVVIVTFLPALGCGRSTDRCVPPTLAEKKWVDLNRACECREIDPGFSDRLAVVIRPDELPAELPGRPINALALSGGGKYGAFGAGVINGWTASGTRPTFDVVTGISTGALIAPFAFLGPRYDGLLEELFTNVRQEDLFQRRRFVAILFSVSVASSDPLKELIDRNVTPQLLAEIAAAHEAGRRLYIGTTNLDSRRLVVWDMGALARDGELELFRKVILASAAVPGLLPPVEIDVELDGREYTELHVDGGVNAAVFMRPYMLGVQPGGGGGDRAPPGSNVWVIDNGKLYSDPSCVGAGPLRISAEAFSTTIYAQTRNDMGRIYIMSLLVGAKFHLAAVPQDFEVDASALTFEPEELRRLFRAGHELGRAGGTAWQCTPPDLLGEKRLPRTGTRFRTTDEPIRGRHCEP